MGEADRERIELREKWSLEAPRSSHLGCCKDPITFTLSENQEWKVGGLGMKDTQGLKQRAGSSRALLSQPNSMQAELSERMQSMQHRAVPSETREGCLSHKKGDGNGIYSHQPVQW